MVLRRVHLAHFLAFVAALSGCGGGDWRSDPTRPLTVTTLGVFADITEDYGQASFMLTPPTSDSAGAFSYVSARPEVVAVSGSTVTIVAAGAGTITAVQAANGNYESAGRVAQVVVDKVAPTISWAVIIKNYNDPPFMLTPPSTNSTGAVTLYRSTTRALSVSTQCGHGRGGAGEHLCRRGVSCGDEQLPGSAGSRVADRQHPVPGGLRGPTRVAVGTIGRHRAALGCGRCPLRQRGVPGYAGVAATHRQ